ncbi:phosphoglycerate mutase-like protein [Venturia nashicola]|uniref:Phosphoglycerate mutase-like protein n=1 Tax=Venturia nashicola TaxID=86259 RepID=A0A4Z1PF78_9PEZI|nr:phosphoglycerate mutase-like protein [Venturia nashicola]TLD34674.1 phosphoglycerate mutase-like protein [Venturia nashicola]
MFALYVALLAAVWASSMDRVEAQNHTIHASVIFARTGDRTPFLSAGTPHLTSLGAQQMSSLGQYFRRRYIASAPESPLEGAAVLTGLSSWNLDNEQVFVQTIDTMYTAQSATAFMQALYPPHTLRNSTATYLDPSSILSDSTYLEAPLNGYQYAMINTVSQYDPYSAYLDGATGCPNLDNSALQYYVSEEFNTTNARTTTMYQSIGHAMLEGVLPQIDWSYANAYLIWDYVTYQNNHDPASKAILDSPGYRGDIDQMGALASKKQARIYGDLTPSYALPGDRIRATAGKTLAARMVGMLLDNIASLGRANKLNLFVGEYPPMLSLFSLLGLAQVDEKFKHIPPFASAIALELFSWAGNGTTETNGDGLNYPDQNSLWVRFLYVNGSLTSDNSDQSIKSYPLFQRGPSETDMKWTEFKALMSKFMMSEVSDWCIHCNSQSVFCPALIDAKTSSSMGSSSNSKKGSNMTPQVAGVIGAAVTIGTFAIALALAMLFGGIRFFRVDKGKKSESGGFKGSAKMASDQDLHLPKNAAPVGVSAVPIDGDIKKGHERIGSWELKDAATKDMETQRNTFVSLGGSTVASLEPDRKPSYERDEEHDAINPFENPVHARESV